MFDTSLARARRQNSIPKNLTKRLCRSAKHAISGDLTPDSVQLLAVSGRNGLGRTQWPGNN